MKTTMPGSLPKVRKAKAIHETKQANRNASIAKFKQRGDAIKRAR